MYIIMLSIITGEKIQQLCDIYLGNQEDFNFNHVISKDIKKHSYLNTINCPFDNEYRVFCYSHNINLLSQKIHLFKNNFILITHNSDVEIRETSEIFTILNCKKLQKWYGQNICFEHPKLYFLPIGIANSQWPHGNLSIFADISFMKNLSKKTHKVYFNFRIDTNKIKRQDCYVKLINKLQWLNNITPTENLKRLSNYEFCICPGGNGVDTHRLWECLYLKVVPIVIKSEFTTILLKHNIPLLILNNWEEFDSSKLNYNDYNFNNNKHLENILNLDVLKLALTL
jgi:hypothetical protein